MVDLQQLDLSGLPDKAKKPKLDLTGLPDKQKKQTPVVAAEPPATPPASSRTAADIDLRKLRQLDFSGVQSEPRQIPDDQFLTDKEPTILDRLATGSMRIGGGLGGAILGAAAGTEVPIIGNIIGGIMGGAAGSAAGDERAQAYEIKHGLRKKYSLAQTAIEGVTGAIPGGKFIKGGKVLAQAGREAVRGAAINTAATIAQSELERGEMPAFKDAATSAVMGAILGGGMGAGAQAMRNRGGRARPVGADAPVPGKLDDIPLTPVPEGEAPVPGASYVTLGGKKFKIEPMASHGAPTTTFVNRDAVPSQFHEFNQYFGSHVVGEAKTALESGDEVFFRAGPGGKNRVRIVSVADGLLTDAYGQKWSTDLMVADPAQGLEVVSRRARPVADSVSSNVAKAGVLAAHEASKETPIETPITPMKPVASHAPVVATETTSSVAAAAAESADDVVLLGKNANGDPIYEKRTPKKLLRWYVSPDGVRNYRTELIKAAPGTGGRYVDDPSRVNLHEPVGTQAIEAEAPAVYSNKVVHVTTPQNADAIEGQGFKFGASRGIGGDSYGDGVYLADAQSDVGSFWRNQLATSQSAGEVPTTALSGQVDLKNPLVFDDVRFTSQGISVKAKRRDIVRSLLPDQLEQFDSDVLSGSTENMALANAARRAGRDGLVMQRSRGDEIVAFDPSSVRFTGRDGSAVKPAAVKLKAAEELSDAEMVALEREPVVAEKLADVPTLKPGEEPVRTSRILPDEEDVDMAEFGTLGRPQEIPPADAPVPKRFLDNPRAVREQVRRIVAELDAVQFEQGTVLTGDDLDANFMELGFTERPGSRESFEANKQYPNLKKMNPNAPIFRELMNARPKVDANGKQVSVGGGKRSGRAIRNAGIRYIEGKGKPTPIAEDIVQLARKIARGDLKFRDWKLPEDAGKVAEDFASSRPDADAVRLYDNEFPEAFASTEQLTGEPTPNISAPMPGSPIGAGSGGRGGSGGGGRPPGGGDPDFIPPTGGEGEGPVTRTAPGKMGEEQQQRGIQLLGFDKAVRPALKGMLEATEGFEAHRRGVQSFGEHTKVLADQIAVDIEQSLPRGRALNAEETVAYANRLAETTERVTSLAKRVQAGTASIEETMQLAVATQEQYVLQKSLWGSVSETGRALNAWRLMMGILETGDTKFMKWAVKQGIGDDMEQLAEKLAQIGDDPVQRFKWLQSEVNAKMSKMDMLKAYYYGNLLSGVATHERNFLSNASNLLFSVGSDVATGRAGHAAASVKGITSALFKRSPAYGGTALGLPKAIQTFVDEMKYGFNPANLDANGVMYGGRVAAELPGGIANPWNATRRALDAADGFFRTLTREGEKYRFAYDIAKNSPDQDFAATMAKAYANIPADKMRDIEAVVSKGVFQEEPGKIAKAVMGLQKSLGPAGWVVMPFIRIAANITHQGIEVTPYGWVKNAKNITRGGDLARSRAVAGSLLMLPLAAYAAAGKITGNGPSDPGERAAWLESGKRPNSIWNPATNQWVSYQAWQPMAFPMSVIANMIESVHDLKARKQKREGVDDLELEEYPSLLTQAFMRTSGSVLNQSFLSGVSSLMDALNQPERSASKFIGNVATGFMPLSGATRTAAQVFDRTQRAPEGIVESVKGVIPGVSKTVEPMVDRFGEPVDSQGNPLTRGFYQASASRDDALAKVLDSVGIFPQRPRSNLDGVDGKPVKLTRPEETVLMMARGRARRQAYEQVVANPAFASWPKEQKEAALEAVARSAVAAVTGRARGFKAASQPLTLEKLLLSGKSGQ